MHLHYKIRCGLTLPRLNPGKLYPPPEVGSVYLGSTQVGMRLHYKIVVG